MSKLKNEPAFPVESCADHEFTGMSLRDYFASQALTGLIGTYVVGNGTVMGTEHFAKNVSIHAYKMADAMLAARSS
jgi:hypothetical protein